jgi:hypothetical protein
MDNQTMSAVLWIAAIGFLALYLLRRKTRKLTQKP